MSIVYRRLMLRYRVINGTRVQKMRGKWVIFSELGMMEEVVFFLTCSEQKQLRQDREFGLSFG